MIRSELIPEFRSIIPVSSHLHKATNGCHTNCVAAYEASPWHSVISPSANSPPNFTQSTVCEVCQHNMGMRSVPVQKPDEDGAMQRNFKSTSVMYPELYRSGCRPPACCSFRTVTKATLTSYSSTSTSVMFPSSIMSDRTMPRTFTNGMQASLNQRQVLHKQFDELQVLHTESSGWKDLLGNFTTHLVRHPSDLTQIQPVMERMTKLYNILQKLERNLKETATRHSDITDIVRHVAKLSGAQRAAIGRTIWGDRCNVEMLIASRPSGRIDGLSFVADVTSLCVELDLFWKLSLVPLLGGFLNQKNLVPTDGHILFALWGSHCGETSNPALLAPKAADILLQLLGQGPPEYLASVSPGSGTNAFAVDDNGDSVTSINPPPYMSSRPEISLSPISEEPPSGPRSSHGDGMKEPDNAINVYPHGKLVYRDGLWVLDKDPGFETRPGYALVCLQYGQAPLELGPYMVPLGNWDYRQRIRTLDDLTRAAPMSVPNPLPKGATLYFQGDREYVAVGGCLGCPAVLGANNRTGFGETVLYNWQPVYYSFFAERSAPPNNSGQSKSALKRSQYVKLDKNCLHSDIEKEFPGNFTVTDHQYRFEHPVSETEISRLFYRSGELYEDDEKKLNSANGLENRGKSSRFQRSSTPIAPF